MSLFRRDPAHISIGGWPAWLLMTDRVYAALTTNADYQAAQCNSLALAVPSPDLDNRSDAWMRHRYVWRGVASIIHRNNARRA